MKCPPEHRHGATTTCYFTHGCRCADCRAARSARNSATYVPRPRPDASQPEGPAFTLTLTGDEVPLVAAAALDRALWLEKDGGNHHGSAGKATTLRRIHRTLITHHRTTQGATP